MRRLTTLALTLTTLWMTGCCGNARYWRATHIETGRVYYTADTARTPIHDLRSPVFVSSDGKIVGLSSYELEPIGEANWREATGAFVEVKDVYIGNRIECKAVITPATAGSDYEHWIVD